MCTARGAQVGVAKRVSSGQTNHYARRDGSAVMFGMGAALAGGAERGTRAWDASSLRSCAGSTDAVSCPAWLARGRLENFRIDVI